MITTADVNKAVGRRKLEILMTSEIGRRIIKAEAVSSMVRQNYTQKQAEDLFDLIDKGLIKNVAINDGGFSK